MPPGRDLKQIVTSVNPKQLKQIKEYVKKMKEKLGEKKFSIYKLLKKAAFEYMERHPPEK